jgi:hypothetical protein
LGSEEDNFAAMLVRDGCRNAAVTVVAEMGTIEPLDEFWWRRRREPRTASAIHEGLPFKAE